MIDYDQIHHCLMHIISDCENGTDIKDIVESVTYTAKHALGLMESAKNKYKIGQEVWMLSDEYEPVSFIIDDIDDGSEEKYLGEYGDNVGWWVEEKLYPSKAQLIEAQIEYWTNLKISEISESKTCPKCGMQRMKDGVCWSPKCSLPPVPFEGEIKGFNAEYALSDEGQSKIREGWRQLLQECQHESDGNYHCTTEGMIIERMDKCLKCGEFYK